MGYLGLEFDIDSERFYIEIIVIGEVFKGENLGLKVRVNFF